MLYQNRIEGLAVRLRNGLLSKCKQRSARLSGLASRLENLSHKKVLNRGFSIVRMDDKIVSSARSVKEGSELDITFASGALLAEVKKKKAPSK